MTGPRVDVIVPCYNYGRFLRSCARSVLAERGLPLRLLILDDASTDDSAAVARELAAGDPRVEVRVHARNLGHIATYNEGLDWVRAPYLLLLSADDMVAPGALTRAVEVLDRHPGVGLAHGRAARFSDEGELAGSERHAPMGARIVRGWDFIRELCERPVNPVETPTAVVRTAVQRRAGGYRPALPHAGDFEMWLRCAAEADVAVLDDLQAYVRLHSANMRHGFGGAEDIRQRRDALASFFRLHPDPVLHSAARRSLALEVLREASNSHDHGRPAGHLPPLAREIDPAVALAWPYWRLALKRRWVRPGGRRRPTPSPTAAAAQRPGGRPRLTLIVSTRDRAHLLAPCLARLEAIETSAPWELVFVDSGSRDATWEVLQAFAAGSRHAVRLLQEPRPGLSRARNAGVRAARGDILAFTDDDCYPPPDFIDAILGAFADHEIDFLGGQVRLHDPQDAAVCITQRTETALFPPGGFIQTGEIQGACMAYRREVFADVGLFDCAFGAGAPLKGAEDCEMAARASFAGWRGGFVPGPQVEHHHRRRGAAAARIVSGYDYSRGAFFAKLILASPGRRWALLREWAWATPLPWRPSRRLAAKAWRELCGATHYLLGHAGARPPHLTAGSSQ